MTARPTLVLGIHDLSRRPGTMRELDLEVSAPADLTNEVVGVPAGEPMQVTGRLDSVIEGVLASGTITAPLRGECVRCLGPVSREIHAEFSELFAYPGAVERDPQDEEAEDILEVIGEEIDLEQTVRDAVGLELPFQPLCRPDCQGLCPQCGKDLNTDPHEHDNIDIRWAALVDALNTDESEEPDEGAADGDSATQ